MLNNSSLYTPTKSAGAVSSVTDFEYVDDEST